MSDFLINSIFLVIGLALALAGATLGAWLQHRGWKHQDSVAYRHQLEAGATAALEGLTELLDFRLYRQRRFLWALRSSDPAVRENARLEYAHAVERWNDQFGTTKARLWNYFDRYTMVAFEDEIHREFQATGTVLEQHFRANTVPPGLTKISLRLDELGRRYYEFTYGLQRRIRMGEMADLAKYNQVSHGNWENVSIALLLKRLFGVTH